MVGIDDGDDGDDGDDDDDDDDDDAVYHVDDLLEGETKREHDCIRFVHCRPLQLNKIMVRMGVDGGFPHLMVY